MTGHSLSRAPLAATGRIGRWMMPAVVLCLGAPEPAGANAPAHPAPPAQTKALPPAPPLTIQSAPLVEMVRALKSLQNRLATGDEGALKASQEQVNAILLWLEDAPVEVWHDGRNVRALAVFLLGGGSIGAARAPLVEANVSASDRVLIRSVLAYADGRFDQAQELKSINALQLEPILGAHIALAQATLQTDDAPSKAYELLTQSAVLAPGTLIEEAALRRQIVMSAGNRGTGNLARVVELYVRRFGASVYRRGLIDVTIEALGRRDFETKDEVLGVTAAARALSQGEQSRIGLFLAEKQIAQGHLEWARALADQVMTVTAQDSDERVRAQLYQAVSGVFLGPSSAAAVLDTIDLHKLSSGDEFLVKAAKEVSQALVATASFDPKDTTGSFEAPAVVSRARVLVGAVDKLLGGRRGP